MQWPKRFFGSVETRPGPAPTLPAGPEMPAAGTYFSDAPIASPTQDTFNRWPFAKRIAETIATRRDASSIVIGLFGPWGDGKTSTLNMMATTLAEHVDVVTVRFNPWLFRSEEQLLRGFFSTLADAIGKSLPTAAEKFGELLKRYGALLSIVPQVDVGKAAKGLGEVLSEVKLDELRDRVDRLLEESRIRVVVLIDDIDRLDRAETHAILKLVKLSGSFAYTCYVLAFDEEMVAAAIGERYGDGSSEAGRSFLEKIIQVPLHLPPPDPIALRRTTFEGVQAALDAAGITLSEEAAGSFTQRFIDGLESALRTPRHAKLYANAVLFALPLLKNEANPVDQLLIEGIRIFHPRLYKAIRDDADLFVVGDREGERGNARRQRIGELVDGALGGMLERDKQRFRERLLEELFPRLGAAGYGADWDAKWESEQRICAAHYFNRYFTYSVPPGDTSDLEVAQLLDALEPANADPVDGLLTAFATKNAMPQLIRKLRLREDSTNTVAARRLALAIGRNGSLMPREQGTFFAEATGTQAAILAAQLLRRVPAGAERDELATELVRTADPLPFADECFSWIHHNKDRPEERRILSNEAEARIAPILVERIHQSADALPLYTSFGHDAPRMYWLWATHGSAANVREHLEKRFAEHPEEVDVFLDSFLGEAHELTTGRRRKADFYRGSYDAIAQLLDPKVILDNLRQRYGAELDTAQFDQGDDVPIPRRIARQFAFIHRSIQAEAARAKGAPPDAA